MLLKRVQRERPVFNFLFPNALSPVMLNLVRTSHIMSIRLMLRIKDMDMDTCPYNNIIFITSCASMRSIL